jgi:prepilin peptidase CpaA
VEKYFILGALALAASGAVTDIGSRKIPNWLTYGGLLAAIPARFFALGWPGLTTSLIGVIAGGGIFFVLFLLGGMGGGDVKLMAAVGAWAGAEQTVVILIATAIAGGIIGLAYMIFHGKVLRTLANTFELLRHHLTSGLRPHPELNIQEPGTLRIPYALAIAIGTLYCFGKTFAWG